MSKNAANPSPAPWTVSRKYPRARLLVQVEARVGGITTMGRTQNVSETGLCLLSPETFDPQTEVLVRFNLSAGRPIEAKGLVVRALPGVEMGIVFVDLKNDDRGAIADFVNQAGQ